MKIVDITEFYSERGGGIRSHLTDRARFLSKHDHRHVVIAPGPRDEVAAVAAESRSGRGQSTLVRFAGPTQPYDKTYYFLQSFRKIRRRVRAESPDVLEAHSPYLATAAVLAAGRTAARLKTAFWHSDHIGVYLEPMVARHVGPIWASSMARGLMRGVRGLLAPFDATFAAGRRQAERLRAAGVRRVIHIPFGVDKQTFRPSARRDEWRAKIGADGDTAILVGAGRFAAEKHWEVVLEAFRRVRTHRKAVLVLFGDGPERRELERQAPPGVNFVGFERDRTRLATGFASADILVHGAPYETFGLSIAEAVACGVPIVVPDGGGAAEHTAPACSEIYRSLDPIACAAAIESLLARRPEALRARALEVAEQVPPMENHFRQVLAAYDELLRELGR
ncbi:MAG: glycosyltransferase [Polyangiaceae bacterium]